MAKKQFKTESKRMLDLMINSIYTNQEIFLRELISNASDAIDKLYFKSLTDESVGLSREDFKIDISIDKENRLLKISDNGIGMTEEELDKNLGTIAKSGSLQFSKENETDGHDVDIIGQFGVGFYAAFMVADRVEVVSKAYGTDAAFCWASNGLDGYTVTPAEKETVGTDITLHLKPSTEEADYDKYLETYTISALVKKYSDYIRFPIQMDMEHSRPKEGGEEGEYETYIEHETVNSMVPLWKKNKSEITEEEYESEDSSEEYKSRHELRKAYWEIALPYIKEANKNADGTGPFAKVSAGKNNYIDGFFGMQIIHLYCKVNQQPQLCSAGLWIDCGDETRNKKAFDFLYAHREEIEAHVSMPIVWNRKDEHRACSIDVVLPDSNIWNKNDWPRMAQFQAKTTKELADYVVRAYEQTLKDM